MYHLLILCMSFPDWLGYVVLCNHPNQVGANVDVSTLTLCNDSVPVYTDDGELRRTLQLHGGSRELVVEYSSKHQRCTQHYNCLYIHVLIGNYFTSWHSAC